jgi:hypothetical protein
MADNNQVLQALGYPTALPQSVVPVTKTSTQVQKTSYAPDKLEALMTALQAPRLKKSRMETLAGALAGVQDAPSFKGAYGVDVINPWAVGLSSLAQGFGGAYGDRLASAREAAMQEREDAIKAAQIALDADKAVITDQTSQDFIKVNDPNAGADTAYRFEPEKIQELKDLNDKSGRWYTETGKAASDVMNTESSKAYNEFEGKAKQYVQDQLKKIYGAQMTEAEGERFFKSMGLSPYLDPQTRWTLVENALDDLARKSGKTIKQESSAADAFMKGTI